MDMTADDLEFWHAALVDAAERAAKAAKARSKG